jgi:nucleoside-diphosphate-sugar epimerase
MKILLFGAGGFLGSAIARNLAANGDEVSVLARDAERAATFAEDGLAPVTGDLEDISALAGAIGSADAVVFAASVPFDREWPVFEQILARMHAGQTFVMTSGTGVLSHETPLGEWRQETYAEDEPFTPPPWIALRVETENKVREASAGGVRTMVVRPPQIWGLNGSKQIPALFEAVKSTGAACYIGHGLNLYTHVHVEDLAEVYRLALRKGVAGALYHAVAGEACWKSLAEAVGQVMGVPARSVTIEESRRIWGDFIGPLFFGVSSRSRAVRTRDELGWAPTRLDVVEDVRSGSYSVRGAGA